MPLHKEGMQMQELLPIKKINIFSLVNWYKHVSLQQLKIKKQAYSASSRSTLVISSTVRLKLNWLKHEVSDSIKIQKSDLI